MKKQELTITPALVEKYAAYLKEQERAPRPSRNMSTTSPPSPPFWPDEP